MAEIRYLSEYNRHQVHIDSLAESEKMGEVSLCVTARSKWGGDHTLSQAYVLLNEDDLLALRESIDACLTDIKERKIRDKQNGKVAYEPEPEMKTKKFEPRRPRKRLTTKKG